MCLASKVYQREKFSMGTIFVVENSRREKVTKFQENAVTFPRQSFPR